MLAYWAFKKKFLGSSYVIDWRLYFAPFSLVRQSSPIAMYFGHVFFFLFFCSFYIFLRVFKLPKKDLSKRS